MTAPVIAGNAGTAERTTAKTTKARVRSVRIQSSIQSRRSRAIRRQTTIRVIRRRNGSAGFPVRADVPRARRKPVDPDVLHARLDRLVETFDVSTISPDPLELVRRFNDSIDQEVAGIIAAAFAYGRAETIVANIGAVLARMRPSPHRYLLTF